MKSYTFQYRYVFNEFISKTLISFCSEKVDIPCDQVIDNLQDHTSLYEGMTYAQQCFVNLKTRELIKKWVDAKSNANDIKKLVLHTLKSHRPDRTSVYNYIKYLPDHLDKGATKMFLKK